MGKFLVKPLDCFNITITCNVFEVGSPCMTVNCFDNRQRVYCHATFFRSTAWNLNAITLAWVDILRSTPVLLKEADWYILIGDGVKEVKEGRKMPGVKSLHQESDNSSKGEYIHGQLFGGIGILT